MKNILPEMKSCNIYDSKIQYLHYKGSGNALVLLHATGFNPWLWHPIARELASGFDIYAPYFCDHRYAEPEKGGLSWKIIAKDLYHFCKNLKITNPFVAGHSMGATVITLCTANHNITPEKIILIEPIFLPEGVYQANLTVEQHPLASKSIKRKNQWGSPQEARDYLKARELFKEWDNEMIELYIKHGMACTDNGTLKLSCSPRKEASLFMGGSAQNPWPLLPEISCPVLVVEGETSDNKNYIDLKKVTSSFPSGTYTEIKGAGHLIPMEKPAEIISIIKNFFI